MWPKHQGHDDSSINNTAAASQQSVAQKKASATSGAVSNIASSITGIAKTLKISSAE